MTDADATPAPRPAVLARPAPFLRRVRIRNYKSIRFCDVTLEPLTVFVGRNGSGKSNFFDALAFLSDLMDNRVAVAVERHGGWKRIHRRQAGAGIGLGFDADFESTDGPCQASYKLELEPDADGQARVVYERLDVSGTATRPNPGQSYEFKDGYARMLPDPGTNGASGGSFRLPEYGGPFLRVSDLELHREFSDLLRTSRTFAFEPARMRVPVSGKSAVLARDGHNLAAALRALAARTPEFAERAGQFLNAAVPQVMSCASTAVGEYEILVFDVAVGLGAVGPFDAASVSDGTLRALAALVAAYEVLPGGRPGFVAIEEPETGIHPFAAHVLMAAFDEAALSTQVLVSTHSPDLLDAEEVTPERVRVVQFIDGETVIGPVGEAGASIVRDHLNTLGGLERDDRLTADEDDLDRQRQTAGGRE